jgi:hypothetical protein
MRHVCTIPGGPLPDSEVLECRACGVTLIQPARSGKHTNQGPASA